MALIAWYPLNGDTLDYSGNGYNLTNSGAVIDTNGKIGSCYSFGDNRYLLSDTIDIKGDISMCLWFKPTGTPLATTWGGILSNHHHPSPPSNFTLNYNVNGSVYVHAGFTDGTRGAGISSPGNLVNSDVWSHIVFTYDIKTNTGSIYVNGVRVTKSPFPKQPKITPYNFILGQWAPTYLNNYEVVGNINDVRIYDHALSEKEVKDLSKAMILHYKFDDFQEPTVNLGVGDFEEGSTSPFTIYNNGSSSGVTASISIADADAEGIPRSPKGSSKVLKITINNTVGYTGNVGWVWNGDNTANTTYTQSAYMLFPSDITALGYTNNGGITNNKIVIPTPSKTEWQKYERTFTVGTSDYNGDLHFYARNPGQLYVFYMDMHQLEEHDHATPYTDGTRDGIVRDSSGYRNDATLSVPFTPKWVDNSKIGKGAYDFDRTLSKEQYMRPTVPIYHSWVDEITLSTWIKIPSNVAWSDKAYHGNIIGRGDYNGSIGLVKHPTTVGYVGLWMRYTGIKYVGGTISLDEWHHIAGTSDGTNMKFYIDGIEISTTSIVGITDTPTQGFWNIGGSRAFSGNVGDSFHGQLDDVRIYATALSSDAIKELYETRTSITENAKLYINNQTVETNHKPLLLDYTSWQDGQTGSVGQFIPNGPTAGNTRVTGLDPWGKETILWESISNGISGANGGWNSESIPIDKTKKYRSSVWVRRTVPGNGSFYIGCLAGNTYNLNDTVNNNPYFYSGGINHQEWMLFVGYIHPSDYVGTTSPESGVYTKYEKIGDVVTDYKHGPSATHNNQRSYLYYSTNSTTTQQWCYPRFEVCDGTEPTIQELMNGFDSRYIDIVRNNGGSKPINLKVGDQQTHLGEIHEIGFPIRYIRESTAGSTVNTNNHIVEIQAYDPGGNNVALGKSATSSLITDGSTITNPYYSGTPPWTVNLGAVYTISYVKIWHYWGDFRTYHDVKTEVSADGTNWITIFDSNIDGEYAENEEGRTTYLRPQKFQLGADGKVYTNEIIEV